MLEPVPTAEDLAETAARGGIQALDTALVVLRVLAGCPGPVTLTELARRAGMPVSKAHRYLASFIHAGLVAQRERSGRYELGPFARELGLAALGRTDILNRAADGIEALGQATGLTVLMTVWAEGGATVVRWERAASPVLTSFGLGSTLPLLSSASGRIFLGFLPRHVTATRLKLEMQQARTGGLKWPDVELNEASIDGLIKRVRSGRWAALDGRFIPGLKAIGAPVTNWQGEAELAITLIGISDDILDPNGAARVALRTFTDELSIPRIGRGASTETTRIVE
jgi:DNA-binding IclR family transcriptional regulator